MAAALFLKDKFDRNKTLEALSEGYFHGRFEEIARGFFVDGAHNEDAMHKLLESVKTLKGKKVIIFGACKDKDYEKMLHLIDESGNFDTIILTNIDSERAVDSATMRECTKDFKSEVITTESLREAIDISKTFDSAVYIAGSLYLVGEAVSIFKNKQ
jgi:dihydrofolate synthase/folylpolyglutamate synthase